MIFFNFIARLYLNRKIAEILKAVSYWLSNPKDKMVLYQHSNPYVIKVIRIFVGLQHSWEKNGESRSL